MATALARLPSAELAPVHDSDVAIVGAVAEAARIVDGLLARGRPAAAREVAMRVLHMLGSRRGPGGQEPGWRACALALLARAEADDGRPAVALDALAQALALVDADDRRHGACVLGPNALLAQRVVGRALVDLDLFEPAVALAGASAVHAVRRAKGRACTRVAWLCVDQAEAYALWALNLEFVAAATQEPTRQAERRSRAADLYAQAASAALAAREWADPEHQTQAEAVVRAAALEAFAVVGWSLCAREDGDDIDAGGLAAARARVLLATWPPLPGGDRDARNGLSRVPALLAVARDELRAQRFPQAQQHILDAMLAVQGESQGPWPAAIRLIASELAVGAEASVVGRGARRRWQEICGQAVRRRWSARVDRLAAVRRRRAEHELALRGEQIARQHLVDPVTGAGNRLLLDVEMARGRVGGVLFVDVDNLATIVDERGQVVADLVLRELVTILRNAAGPRDVVIRYAREEFVVLVSAGRSATQVGHYAEAGVADHDWSPLLGERRPRVSVGASDAVTDPGLQVQPDATPAPQEPERRVAVHAGRQWAGRH